MKPAMIPTRDNILLSRPTLEPATIDWRVAQRLSERESEIDFTAPSAGEVEAYVRASIAPATRRAYRADIDHFEAWGGTIPATGDMLAADIGAQATTVISRWAHGAPLAPWGLPSIVVGQPGGCQSSLAKARKTFAVMRDVSPS